MNPELRLVMQSQPQYLHGDYSGTDRRYVLQCRVFGAPWKTCAVVDFDTLSADEQSEIITALGGS